MDNSSWATEIMKFEDTLAKDSSSYCFAPLAELYRKSGMLDEAISTAKKGTALHPQYVGGFMALGRAYLDKGMISEAREALQKVVSFTPENMLAQKLLCKIYLDAGEQNLLRRSLEALVLLNPADTESRMLLESLGSVPQEGDASVFDAVFNLNPEEVHTDVLEELDLLDELVEVADAVPPAIEREELPAALTEDYIDESHDEESGDLPPGMQTATIADLYAAQGHYDQALEIYRELSLHDPGNQVLLTKIAELEKLLPENSFLEMATFFDGQRTTEECSSIQDIRGSDEDLECFQDPEPENISKNDQVVDLLQGWMDNIRRVRECRSGRG